MFEEKVRHYPTQSGTFCCSFYCKKCKKHRQLFELRFEVKGRIFKETVERRCQVRANFCPDCGMKLTSH